MRIPNPPASKAGESQKSKDSWVCGTCANPEGCGEPQIYAASSTPPNTGAKEILMIRARFAGQSGNAQGQYNETLTDALAASLLNAGADFAESASYGQISFPTRVVSPTVQLPLTGSQYATLGTNKIKDDARAAAAALGPAYDWQNYDLHIVAHSHISQWSFAGLAALNGNYIHMNGTWAPNTVRHELGHVFGKNHSQLLVASNIVGPGNAVEYGNPFCALGSAGWDEPSSHYNLKYKREIGWIPDSQILTLAAADGGGVFRIFALEDPISTGLHGLEILPGAPGGDPIYVEFRRLFTSNNRAVNGVILNKSLYKSQLLDMTPQTPGETILEHRKDSPLVLGQTFSYTDYHLTPVALANTSPPSIDVALFRAAASNLAPSVNLQANATVIPTNTVATLQALATDGNGDALAYYWQFGADTQALAPNAPSIQRSWSATGTHEIRCTVSDMKGGASTGTTQMIVSNDCMADIGYAGPGQVRLQLCANGLSQPNRPATLILQGGKPLQPFYLFLSDTPNPSPFHGGTLVPYPSLDILGPLSTDALGEYWAPFTTGVGSKKTVYLQAVVGDGSGGWEFSNVMQGQIWI